MLYGKRLIVAASIISAAIVFIIVGAFLPASGDPGAQTVRLPGDGAPYVSFDSGHAAVGVPLNAAVNNISDTSSFTWQWYINNEEIEGAVSSSYTPSESDLEKFISVKADNGAGSSYTASLYFSTLPVIYINSKQEAGDDYTSATMAAADSEEYASAGQNFYRGNIQIKLRGNSTRYLDKRPYKITLDTPADLYGMGENKHYVLLANAIDHTLVRNKIVYDLSGDLGSDYMSSLNVVLIFNNDYRGVYQLCEQIRIDESRINIAKWSDIAKEAAKAISDSTAQSGGMSPKAAGKLADRLYEAMKSDLSWISAPHTFIYSGIIYVISDYIDIPPITGGYILEGDFYNLRNVSSVHTNYSQPFYFNKPEPLPASTCTELMNYARKHLQSFEYALHSYDFTYHNSDPHYIGIGLYYKKETLFEKTTGQWLSFTQPTVFDAPEYDGMHYTKFFDFQSLINNWLICEFTMNWDSMKNSVFITKDFNMPAKLAPVWDFDWAFGNRNMYATDTNFPIGWHTTNDDITSEYYYQSVQWNRFLIKDPYFLFSAYNKYKEIRPTLIEDIIKPGGTLDTYKEKLAQAAAANDMRWGYTYPKYRGLGFEGSHRELREFIDTRMNWLDKQFSSFDTFVKSTGYYKKSDIILIGDCSAATGSVSMSLNKKLLNSELYEDAEWYIKNYPALKIQVNGAAYIDIVDMENGNADITIPKSALNPEGMNIINVMVLDRDGNYITLGSDYTDAGEGTKNVDNLYPMQTYKVF